MSPGSARYPEGMKVNRNSAIRVTSIKCHRLPRLTMYKNEQAQHFQSNPLALCGIASCTYSADNLHVRQGAGHQITVFPILCSQPNTDADHACYRTDQWLQL